jgi:hypothetical protein
MSYTEQQNLEFSEFQERIKSWTDKHLYEETRRCIWLSAYAKNNPNSNYHRMCTECYRECSARGLEVFYDIAWHYEAEDDFTREPEFDETGAWVNRDRIIIYLENFKENKRRRATMGD